MVSVKDAMVWCEGRGEESGGDGVSGWLGCVGHLRVGE